MALFWLVPVFGLLIASLRDVSANTASGWWTVFAKPAELTLENYAGLVAGSSAPSPASCCSTSRSACRSPSSCCATSSPASRAT
ncbi:hypothetical protein [Lentzea atacamensis]|uniref:hypothetical protein n=1 Tax=Lentzea atacamensis TaxID=531938 RepID=UPI001B87139D|nr:hypothetical protein [Lentzea atacamensis]